MSKTILHIYKWKKSRNHDLNIGQIRIQKSSKQYKQRYFITLKVETFMKQITGEIITNNLKY